MSRITVSDYIVEVLISNGVTDVFGYQGGMIAYLFDSLGRKKEKINYHSCATEQGAALAACSYAQSSGKIGVAISTSGPGFTNLLTGMANAWFDSIPVLFISGNVNTKDKKRMSSFRQNGFQEIQAAEMARPITKKSVEIELNTNYVECFNDAIKTALEDRRGPVYLDLPINICREYVEFDEIKPVKNEVNDHNDLTWLINDLKQYTKPVIIAGAGIHQAECREEFRKLIDILGIPVVTTMPGVDLLSTQNQYMMGYIGGTARRDAGIVLQNANYVISIGTRLCSKQVGHNMNLFAPKAEKFVRVDIDDAEFERKLKRNEVEFHANIRKFIVDLINSLKKCSYKQIHKEWSDNCYKMHELLTSCDITEGNFICDYISRLLGDNTNIVLDVGKNMNYAAQSMIIKENTRLYMSAGLGTMGYAIPAAVGASYGNGNPTIVITGDGGAQMNIQELNTIAKNNLPIKIFVLNNKALGNIRIFQENYLESRFVATSEKEGDYFSCEFSKISEAYGIKGIRLDNIEELKNYASYLTSDTPVLFEIVYSDCPALPGIVAGGEYLKEGNGLTLNVINEIEELMK